MINDCQNNKIDIIVTKSISRFGRNTAVTMNTLNTLKGYNVDVYFENEEIHSKDSQNTIIITLIEGIAQEESYNRSRNISWGILRKIESGDAQILYRKCYGYCQDEDGNLQIHSEEAQVVQLIYNMYLNGSSILGIIKELETRSIKSPSGKVKWCKRTIDLILSNEKYTGNVVVNKTYNTGFPETKRYINKGERDMFLAMNCNPAIISEEQFEKVKEEKSKRSNIAVSENGAVRKSTHYSSKQTIAPCNDRI